MSINHPSGRTIRRQPINSNISDILAMKKSILSITMMLALVDVVNMPVQAAENNPAEPKYVEVYRYAYMALQEGRWDIYKKLMRNVIDMSTTSGAPAEKRAIYWYEYGRASGVICNWEEAEFALTVASNLDASTGGPVHESLNELGRLNVVRKHYDKAVDYFIRAAKAFVQYNDKNPDKKITNQLGSARVFEDFAYALEQIGGQQSDVKRLRDEVAEVRKKFTGKEGVSEDVTPYGSQCSAR
jgi:tetratricopeptide (TPR) repeat protein